MCVTAVCFGVVLFLVCGCFECCVGVVVVCVVSVWCVLCVYSMVVFMMCVLVC